MPPTTRADAGILLVLLLAAGGCAANRRGAGQAVSPGEMAGRTRQDCAPAALPAQLPPAAAIVDSAALLAALARDAGWHRPGSYTVLSLTFDAGVPLFPVIVHTDLPPLGKQAPGEALAHLVRQHTLPQPPSDSTWGVRLRLDGGGASPAISIARQELCRARAVGASAGDVIVGRALRTLLIADRPMGFSMDVEPVIRPIDLRVLVDPDGSVERVEVPLIPEFQADGLRRAIEQTAPGVRFYPTLRDGVPERAWVKLYAVVGASR